MLLRLRVSVVRADTPRTEACRPLSRKPVRRRRCLPAERQAFQPIQGAARYRAYRRCGRSREAQAPTRSAETTTKSEASETLMEQQNTMCHSQSYATASPRPIGKCRERGMSFRNGPYVLVATLHSHGAERPSGADRGLFHAKWDWTRPASGVSNRTIATAMDLACRSDRPRSSPAIECQVRERLQWGKLT